MCSTAKILAFVLVALLVFAVGCVGAQLLWHATHHRYDMPHTGAYYGHVTASFHNFDEPFYSLRFRGETQPRWRWRCPMNFAYERLQLEWHGESSEGTATVNLPSLMYDSSGRTGVLSPATLTEWLVAHTKSEAPTGEVKRVQSIFDYIVAAGCGSLPAPRHHTYYFEQPVRGHIQHFLLGFGVSGLVYIWCVVWLLLVMLFARRLWR